jgi:hypothetical protein
MGFIFQNPNLSHKREERVMSNFFNKSGTTHNWVGKSN